MQQEKREKLEEYLIRHQAEFYRLAYSYTRNPDAALDVVQEAVVKAISGVGGLRDTATLKTWFYRILVNESLTWLRRNKRLIPQEELPDAPAPENGDTAQRLDLKQAVDRLDPKLRTVIVLRFFEDMKLEEVARVTGVNLSTVKTRLYKGLKLLKVDLQEEGGEEAG